MLLDEVTSVPEIHSGSSCAVSAKCWKRGSFLLAENGRTSDFSFRLFFSLLRMVRSPNKCSGPLQDLCSCVRECPLDGMDSEYPGNCLADSCEQLGVPAGCLSFAHWFQLQDSAGHDSSMKRFGEVERVEVVDSDPVSATFCPSCRSCTSVLKWDSVQDWKSSGISFAEAAKHGVFECAFKTSFCMSKRGTP